MKDVFIKRAKKRSVLAYILLTLALLIIICGIFLVIKTTGEFSLELSKLSLSEKKPEELEISKIMIENVKYKFSIILITFLSMLFFISQTLLKLYRYNILKTDFYLACADSFVLTEEFDEEKKLKFQLLLSTIISEKIILTTPKSPTFSFFGSKGTTE